MPEVRGLISDPLAFFLKQKYGSQFTVRYYSDS